MTVSLKERPRVVALMFLVISSFLLAGCATTTVWYKDGVSESEFKRDNYECYRDSRQPLPEYPKEEKTTYLSPEAAAIGGFREGLRRGQYYKKVREQDDLYRMCMESKDYRQQ